MATLKNIWAYVAGIFVLLIGALFYEEQKNKDLQALKDNSDMKVKDQSLAQHTADTEASTDAKRTETTNEEAQKLDSKDLNDFLNKKL